MAAEQPIYLDHHATTPCDPRVVEEMNPVLTSCFGNPASRQHPVGRAAQALVDRARQRVAELIGCDSAEIVFTSGATESDNLAIKGAALANSARGKHIVTSTVEHKAVLDSCGWLEANGFRVTYVQVLPDGRITEDAVKQAINDDTVLVSIMHANNEIGTINPVGEIGALCRERGVLFHCDAVQALPYLPCEVDKLSIDLLSISAHKMYGPKGVGALYVRRRRPRVRLEPLLDGGGHERGMRSGTLNVPGIVGLGKACELVAEQRERDLQHVRRLRDRLLHLLRSSLPDLIVNGSLDHRLPNNLNVSFIGVRAEALLNALDSVAVSSGSACSSAAAEGSYVLKSVERARGERSQSEIDRIADSSVRFGLGRTTTDKEIDVAAESIISTVKRLRLESDGDAKGVESDCAPTCG